MANVKPKGRWAKDWDRCRNCFTTEIPHKADGLCRRCYMWAYRQAVRAGYVTRRSKRGMVTRSRSTGRRKRS